MDEELIEKFYTSFNLQPSASSLLKNALNQQKSSFEKHWNNLFQMKSLPQVGWSEQSIKSFLLQISGLDSNNFEGVIGMGEREGRVINNLVRKRHFGFAHGMGRSGNLKDSQPKAVGSSILVQITHKLVISALRTWNFSKQVLAGGLNIMPLCTGMTLMLALMSVKSEHKKVIWLRIDQKSCLKSILAGGFDVIGVEGKIIGDEIVTDLDGIEAAILKENSKIHSIVSCISCFAPRAPDSIVQISQLCKKYSIAHIINSAYGATSDRACNLLNEAVSGNGRVDAIVMSLDKNFLVPVGGAIVFGPEKEIIERISGRYAGRAGQSHIIDLFITLIGLGREGIVKLKRDRIACFDNYKKRLNEEFGNEIQLMKSDKNDISMALKMQTGSINAESHDPTSIGAKLFHRNISGCRVVKVDKSVSVVEGLEFIDFGSHSSKWPSQFCYLNVAAAVGSTNPSDIEIFIRKLKNIY